jgi:hypothetical protein
MHIDLRTQTFGSVEVHTSVRDSQVGVTIGNEKGDLRTFLTAEVPGLQTAFRQQDLRFDQIHFLGQSSGLGPNLSGGNDSQQPRHYDAGRASPATAQGADPPRPSSSELEPRVQSPGGLNVHA